MDKGASIFVAGGETLAGRAIIRGLLREGYRNVVNATARPPDLLDRAQIDAFFAAERPAYVFIAAGKSGGILANDRYPAELMLDNLLIGCHVIDMAYRHGVTKLMYLASSCVYPKHATPPMRVESLMAGALEPTSESYALAKIAGIKLCQAYRRQYGADFIAGIPADIFGPGDDFSPQGSHVLAALIRRIHEAKVSGRSVVEIWGTGTPRREFLFADDLARACIFVMNVYSDVAPINLGGGVDLSIRELASLIKDTVGYSGQLRFDTSRPDGMPCKALDSTALHSLGWRPTVPFTSALAETYDWFKRCGETEVASYAG
jgi:GDP-L-fucose synthase